MSANLIPLTSAGGFSTAGNIAANYFIGNGSLLSNINAGNITGAYGNANVEAYLPTSNVIISINSNVANTDSNVANISNAVTSLSGNVYANANVANFLASFGSNVVSTSGNLTGGNIFTTGVVSATGNVSGNNFIGNGRQLTSVSTSFENEIHVAQNGNDTSGDGTINYPYFTIQKGVDISNNPLTDRRTVVIHPGTYIENVTVTNNNTQLITYNLTGASTTISGTLTLANNSQRLSGLKITNLIIAGNTTAYINSSTVTGQFTKSGSGYAEIVDVDLSVSSNVQITGGGTVLIDSNKILNLRVANASASVSLRNVGQVYSPQVTAGTLSMFNCFVQASGSTANAITTSAGTVLQLFNTTIYNLALTAPARISVGGFYQLSDVQYDRANSSLGTSLGAISFFQTANVDSLVSSGNITAAGNLIANVAVIATGNVTGGNIRTVGIMSSTGNVTGGNILTGGLVSATSNVYGNNLFAATDVSATGNATLGNVATGGVISAAGNILTSGLVSATGNILTAGNLSATGNATAGNVLTAGVMSSTGNAIHGNILTAGLVSATANITGGNILTAGIVSSAGNATHGNIATAGQISATGNIISVGYISAAGNIIGNNISINQVTADGALLNYDATAAYAANTIVNRLGNLYISQGNVAANTAFAIGNTANTWNIARTWARPYSAYWVDPTNGDDSYDGSASAPFKTIAKLATAPQINSGASVYLMPGTYSETVTWTQANVNFNGPGFGAGVNLTGTWTLTHSAGSVRFYGIAFTNVQVNASNNTYFDTCLITTFASNGAGGYIEWDNSNTTTGGTITLGTGTTQTQYVNMYNSGLLTTVINQTGLILTTHACLFNSVANVTVTAGQLLAFSTNFSSNTTGTALITAAAGTVVALNGCNLSQNDGTVARVNFAAGSFYSFTSVNFDRANSTLSGTILNALPVSDNLVSLGLISAIGNVVGANFRTAGLITATGNIQGGNIRTVGLISATGNVVGANILTAGLVSATGNITGNFILGNGSLLTGISSGSSNSISNGTSNVTVVAANANVSVGVNGTANIAVFANTGAFVTGVVSATGNVTGNYILGNGSQLTGIITSVSNVVNGSSNLNIGSANANVTISVSTVGNVAVFTPTGVSVAGTTQTSGNITAGNILTAGVVSSTGNISGNIFIGNAATTSTTANGLGYVGMPVNSQAGNSSYTLALTDQGRLIYGNTSITVTVPSNANVAFPLGTTMAFAQYLAGSMSINGASGVTLVLAGTSQSGTRSLSTNGMASLTQVNTDVWFITGTGIS